MKPVGQTNLPAKMANAFKNVGLVIWTTTVATILTKRTVPMSPVLVNYNVAKNSALLLSGGAMESTIVSMGKMNK